MQDLSQSTGQSSQPSAVYSMVTLTPGLADKMFGESAPQTIINTFWEFLNSEVMTANLRDIDVEEIMDRVDIAFTNLLTGLPENQWNDFKIIEQEWINTPNGAELRTTRIFSIVELWDQISAKVKIKCCNSRNGHLIKTITESRSTISQLYEERGTQRAPGYVLPGQAPEEHKSGWRPW